MPENSMDTRFVRQQVSDIYRYGRNDDSRIENAAINFYKEGKKSPSMSLLIYKDQFMDSTIKYGDELIDDINNLRVNPIKGLKECFNKHLSAENNAKQVEKLETVKPYIEEWNNKFTELYPKTMKLRKKLINSNKIVMDKVTPKASWFKKLFLVK